MNVSEVRELRENAGKRGLSHEVVELKEDVWSQLGADGDPKRQVCTVWLVMADFGQTDFGQLWA